MFSYDSYRNVLNISKLFITTIFQYTFVLYFSISHVRFAKNEVGGTWEQVVHVLDINIYFVLIVTIVLSIFFK